VQAIVRRGLEQTNGNYRSLVQLFNMPPADYRRFLRFLRKHHCHLPFQPFRMPPLRSLSPAFRAAGGARSHLLTPAS
jgi:hypothetical protein